MLMVGGFPKPMKYGSEADMLFKKMTPGTTRIPMARASTIMATEYAL